MAQNLTKFKFKKVRLLKRIEFWTFAVDKSNTYAYLAYFEAVYKRPLTDFFDKETVLSVLEDPEVSYDIEPRGREQQDFIYNFRHIASGKTVLFTQSGSRLFTDSKDVEIIDDYEVEK